MAENRCDHELPSSWYSEAVMAYVLLWKVAQHDLGIAAHWKMDLDMPVQPNDESFLRIQAPSSLGPIVDEMAVAGLLCDGSMTVIGVWTVCGQRPFPWFCQKPSDTSGGVDTPF